MTPCNDARGLCRSGWHIARSALVLLAIVGWSLRASAADPRTADSDAPGRMEAGQVFALAIDPHIPTTLYAGTCFGVLKSLDGGDSWQAASTGLPGSYVLALAIDPETPTTVYAGTHYGCDPLSDGGATGAGDGENARCHRPPAGVDGGEAGLAGL